MAPGGARLIAALLLAPLLAGCFGGDDATPAEAEPTAEQAPALGTVALEGGDVVERTATRATLRLEATLQGQVVQLRPTGQRIFLAESIVAELAFPGDVDVAILAKVDWSGDYNIDLYVQDEQGLSRCWDDDDLEGMIEGHLGADCFVSRLPATGEPRAWTVVVRPVDMQDATVPVTLDIIVESLPARPVFEVGEILPVDVQAKDGIHLRGHVYVPNGSGPFPTVLNYSPYHNMDEVDSDARARERDGRTTLNQYGFLLEAGFAVAFVNIRGTGMSDGCNGWFDPAVDAPDSRAVIEHLAAQPWSNGKVGMHGVSWPGYTALAALTDAPEALRAVAPQSGIIDIWALYTRHGAAIGRAADRNLNTAITPSTFVVIGTAVIHTPQGPAGVGPLACASHAINVAEVEILSRLGDKTGYWQARDFRAALAESRVPVFYSNGMDSDQEGHVLQVERLWELLSNAADKRFVLGQWGHGEPRGAMGAQYERDLVDWFRGHLVDEAAPTFVPLVEFQDRDGGVHTAAAWPPAANGTTLRMSDGVLVADGNPVGASTQAFASHDVDPLPDDCPGMHATYVSPPLAEDVLLAGAFTANVTVTSPGPDGNFAVFLWTVDELWSCDAARTVRDGYLAFAPAVLDSAEAARAVTTLRHRGNLEVGVAFPAGRPVTMVMTSDPFAVEVKAGQRLVLTVGGGGGTTAPKETKPLLVVSTGDGILGDIVLPVVEGALRFA